MSCDTSFRAWWIEHGGILDDRSGRRESDLPPEDDTSTVRTCSSGVCRPNGPPLSRADRDAKW
jgi:hypothetical protein